MNNLTSKSVKAFEWSRSFSCCHIFHYTYCLVLTHSFSVLSIKASITKLDFFFQFPGLCGFVVSCAKDTWDSPSRFFQSFFFFSSSLTIYRHKENKKRKLALVLTEKIKIRFSFRRLWNLYDKKNEIEIEWDELEKTRLVAVAQSHGEIKKSENCFLFMEN